MPDTAIVRARTDVSKWDKALYAFLAEKERRSGSPRTVSGYSRMQQRRLQPALVK
ncbi:MAG: hypothetical protein HW416_834 [Chloroflexi bacterium]|nr:hypothetical protein [Chloroflexota bacterium]